ncbi:hypothetical protein GOODEAATRI_034526 [Goodea atripinnis]|uniref:Uncharacterized protein n=1 Tax=Goodea atripinnis TaxID=208336 RepID=A0ABV0PJD7_9TELE
MRRERKSELKQMAGGKDLSGDVGNRYDKAGRAVDDPTSRPTSKSARKSAKTTRQSASASATSLSTAAPAERKV